MTTLGKLISDIRHRLVGVGSYTPNSLELIDDLNEDSLLIKVDSTQGHGPGIYEIGLEKVRAKRVDLSGNVFTLYSFGRGYEGTTAIYHPQGSEMTRAGLFPNSTIAAEINNVLTEIFPMLYAVESIDVEWTIPFVMPSDCVGIVAVFESDSSESGWRRLDRWMWEPDSGGGLKLYGVQAGDGVRITYAKEPVRFDLTQPDVVESDWSQTGLPERITTLLTLGVAYRLSPFADVGNLFTVGQEARSDTTKPPQRGATISRLLQQQFQAALVNETQALQKQHPIRVHRERSGL